MEDMYGPAGWAAAPVEPSGWEALAWTEATRSRPDTAVDRPVAGRERVPAGLDTMPPGPTLAAILSAIDVHQVSGYDRVVVLRAHQRIASHFAAHLLTDMVSIRDVFLDPDGSHQNACEHAADEIRCALHLTRRSADGELSLALALHDRLPQVIDAMSRGDLDRHRARVIDRHTLDLPAEHATAIADTVLDRAPELTTGQLAAWLQRLRITIAPDRAHERYETAHEQRYVTVEATPEGTAHLHAYHLSPEWANAIMRRLTRHARRLRRKTEPRTIDQLRADTLVDLCTAPTSRAGTDTDRGHVDITVDLATLTGLADDPGDLRGYGPVIADIARHIVDQQSTAPWHWTLTHPDTGHPIATGTTRRRPTAHQRRTVTAHHPTCIFPGCRMPATDCDLDHTNPWAQGGPTTPRNLAPLCRHDHQAKTQRGWTYRTGPNGTIHWTSPLDHTYTVRPPPQ